MAPSVETLQQVKIDIALFEHGYYLWVFKHSYSGLKGGEGNSEEWVGHIPCKLFKGGLKAL